MKETAFVNSLYENTLKPRRRLFGEDFHGPFLNWGYWKADTENQIQASENLVDLVVSLLPTKTGRVLEVGCGIGGVSERLTQHYSPEAITGINIQSDQLTACRTRVPKAEFLQMDATDLRFEKDTFDAVISVEAAMHFDTREKFLREALRVLKPGGYLAVADIIGFAVEGTANYIPDPVRYAAQLDALGLAEVRVLDITNDSAQAHADYSFWYLEKLREEGRIDDAEYEHAAVGRLARLVAGRYYIAAGARKPVAQLPAWRDKSAGAHTRKALTSFLVKTAAG